MEKLKPLTTTVVLNYSKIEENCEKIIKRYMLEYNRIIKKKFKIVRKLSRKY